MEISKERLATLTQIWEEDLLEVPTDLIYKSFAEARKKNTQRKIPTPAMVLEAHQVVKNFVPEAQRSHSSHYFGPKGESIPNGTYYTIHRAETSKLSQREFELLTKYREKKLEDQDFLEWEQLTKKKFWYPKGKLQKAYETWTAQEVDEYFGKEEVCT